MPNYYGGVQGPAQYAQYQQSRKDQQMQNMLRMFMQMRSLKERQGQWEQEQALKQQQFGLSQKREASLDKYYKALERQMDASRAATTQRPTPEETATRELDLFEKKEAIKAKFKKTEPRIDPRIKNRLGIIEDAIGLYEGTLKDLQEDMTTDPIVLNNINYALEELYGAKTRLGDNKLIEGDRWNTVRRIAASPSYVKSGAFLERTKKKIEKDKFGFTVGEMRNAPDGNTYKYIGNNQWQMVR